MKNETNKKSTGMRIQFMFCACVADDNKQTNE